MGGANGGDDSGSHGEHGGSGGGGGIEVRKSDISGGGRGQMMMIVTIFGDFGSSGGVGKEADKVLSGC